ncbi:MAG: hypothetical protein PUC73_10825 [Lachnospiraceae bacterium]|nr:hypothetical protein [Lachnospiraceae bacterium]
MPCPEKFRETLVQHNIPQEIISRIHQGFEDLVSSSPKKKKALFFKRATDILCENCDIDAVHSLYERNACCKGGAREKASKQFAAKYAGLSLYERIKHIEEVPNMGSAVLEADGVIRVNAVYYKVGEQFACACSNYNKSGFQENVRKDYCYCCAGHFLHHYQIMLGVKLKTLEIVSSPLDSHGKEPCVIRFAIQ